MYINLLYISLFNFAYLFFLSFLSFLSSQHICFIFIALLPNWHLALVLLSNLCLSVNSVLVDKLFVRQANLLYFIFVGLFWFCLWVYMYMCIFSHTVYCCYKSLPLLWAFAVLWSIPFIYFFLFYISNFLNLLYFSCIYSFVCLPSCFFPLVVNL